MEEEAGGKKLHHLLLCREIVWREEGIFFQWRK
jgi:hypothetical protein